jgi:hydroxypyruvate isomerase
MPRFSANLSFLYPDLAFPQRFPAAAADGFKAVEYLGPYAYRAEEVAGWLDAHGLEQVLFNAPPGNWDSGERGLACLPNRVGEFRESIDVALRYAERLKCTRVHVMAGIAPAGVAAEHLEATVIANLQYAAPRFAEVGVMLLIEPINTRDIPGYWLSSVRQAERVLAAVGSDNLMIQYDIYHAQVMQGDLMPTYERLRHRIGHIQIADHPGRNQPGTGEINYDFVLSELDRLGYDGWIGCEYRPKSGQGADLGWMSGRR